MIANKEILNLESCLTMRAHSVLSSVVGWVYLLKSTGMIHHLKRVMEILRLLFNFANADALWLLRAYACRLIAGYRDPWRITFLIFPMQKITPLSITIMKTTCLAEAATLISLEEQQFLM